MKPLVLQGHVRSITQIKYNEEGDLLFTASKDPVPNVWYVHNGERLGTYNGHSGVIWSIDIKFDSTLFVTGSGDPSIRIWDVETGVSLKHLVMESSVRAVKFSYGGNILAYSPDNTQKKECMLNIIDVRESNLNESKPLSSIQISPRYTKITSLLWGSIDRYIITAHDDGSLMKWDIRNCKLIDKVCEHSKKINDLQMSYDHSLMITSSSDTYAKLWDVETMEPIKQYKTDRPVNSAAIQPLLDTYEHVIVGGGQDAMKVTTSAAKNASFETRFFHMVYEEEFANVKGHFGPINSLAFAPNGRGYASGAEDGFVRVHVFDDTYYDTVNNF